MRFLHTYQSGICQKVYSRIKFDQMVGRGTRLCKNLFGEGEDKKEFYVFDYMRNFQFFEEHPKGKELGKIFTEELGTADDYQMNYQDTPFGLLIRKIAKMNRDAAYAAFSTFIAEERPNAEQIHFIEQVVDYVVENGYINHVLDLMKAPFDRPYKFSAIFTREEQVKFVQVIHRIKNNALVA